MQLTIVGATGLVGRTLLKILECPSYTISKLILVASKKSINSTLTFRGQQQPIINIEEAYKQQPTIAIFAAGSAISLQWAPKFTEAGSTVIDNSAAWRMDKNCPLIVPEVNKQLIQNAQGKIIANPNCTVIPLTIVLAPLHTVYPIKRVVIATYQSVTGSGQIGVDQLMHERCGNKPIHHAYPHPIDLNVIPHIDQFLDNGYTKEEMKVINETKKILQAPSLEITATAVRLPTLGGHAMAVNIQFKQKFELNKIKQLLQNASGIVIEDDPSKNRYPMPLFVEGQDSVFVGRIRKDTSHSLNLWIAADNLRKGAATNALQIAMYLNKNNPITGSI